jgi:hypothetical protein
MNVEEYATFSLAVQRHKGSSLEVAKIKRVYAYVNNQYYIHEKKSILNSGNICYNYVQNFWLPVPV